VRAYGRAARTLAQVASAQNEHSATAYEQVALNGSPSVDPGIVSLGWPKGIGIHILRGKLMVKCRRLQVESPSPSGEKAQLDAP